MKQKIKNNIVRAFLLGGVLAGTAACSDDHFDIVASGTATVSIMDNISEQDDLSGFASILSRTYVMRSEYSHNSTITYADLLSTSQNFTVWAPVDGDSWDPQTYLDILDEAASVRQSDSTRFWELNRQVEMQFVRNHIARANYEATPSLQTVRLMNDKRCQYNIGENTFNDIKMTGSIPSSNGMLRKLSEVSPYAYNISDYLAENPEWSDLYTYIHSQDSLMFDASSSVEGTYIDGELVYADSAWTLSSPISNYLGRIDSEDSTYVGVLPTNSGWSAAYEKYKSYFEYGETYSHTFSEDNGSFTTTGDSVINLYSGTLEFDDDDNADSLQEVMTKTALLSCMFFSATQITGLDVDESTDEQILSAMLTADSLGSDQRYYIYNAASYFGSGEPYYASNGYVYTVESLDIDGAKTIQDQNIVDLEGEELPHVYLSSGSASTVSLDEVSRNDTVKGDVSEDSYARYTRSGDGQMIVDFPLRGVYSAKYDIYVVMLPSNISTDYDATNESIVFNASLFLDDDRTSSPSASVSSVQVEPDTVNTILLFEDFRFEKCYAGLTQTTFPRLRLTLPRGTSSTASALNIDRIYLVPKGND